MKSKKHKLSATTFYLVIIALALVIPNMAFALQSADFTYTVSGGEVTITKYTGGAGVVAIPTTIDGMPVVGIGDNAFIGCTYLTSVTIPNSVTSIGVLAFAGCRGLTSVTIPDSVTNIGREAFQYCTSLTSVTIPDSVTSIGNWAFGYCYGLTSAYFLGNAPSIGLTIFGGSASNFTVCYTAGSTGFSTPTWYGYPAAVCAEPKSTTTTIPNDSTTTMPEKTTTTTSILPLTTTTTISH